MYIWFTYLPTYTVYLSISTFLTRVNCSVMTIDCVAYLMTYELHVLEVYVYGASNAVLYCMHSRPTLQRLRAVCAATARLLLFKRPIFRSYSYRF